MSTHRITPDLARMANEAAKEINARLNTTHYVDLARLITRHFEPLARELDNLRAESEESDEVTADLRAENKRLKQDNHNIQDNYGVAMRGLAALRARVAELEAELNEAKIARDFADAATENLRRDVVEQQSRIAMLGRHAGEGRDA